MSYGKVIIELNVLHFVTYGPICENFLVRWCKNMRLRLKMLIERIVVSSSFRWCGSSTCSLLGSVVIGTMLCGIESLQLDSTRNRRVITLTKIFARTDSDKLSLASPRGCEKSSSSVYCGYGWNVAYVAWQVKLCSPV